MEPELDIEEKRILRVLADDWDKNPGNRARGIHIRRLGAMVGAYVNFPLYSVGELESEGLVSRIGDAIILTDRGYASVRSPPGRKAGWFSPNNPWAYLLLTVGAGLIVAFMVALWKAIMP